MIRKMSNQKKGIRKKLSKQRRQNNENKQRQCDGQAFFDWDSLEELFENQEAKELASAEKQYEKRLKARHITCKMLRQQFANRLEKQRERNYLRRMKLQMKHAAFESHAQRAGGSNEEQTLVAYEETGEETADELKQKKQKCSMASVISLGRSLKFQCLSFQKKR